MLITAVLATVAVVLVSVCYVRVMDWSEETTIRKAREVRNYAELVEFCRQHDVGLYKSERVNRRFDGVRYTRTPFLKWSLFLEWDFDESENVKDFRSHGFSEVRSPSLSDFFGSS